MVYVLRPSIVRRCLWDIADRDIHPHFAGYLGVVHTSATVGEQSGLDFEYNDFFDNYFRVAGGEKPYVVPFHEGDANKANLWLNDNIAGSYAPSSLRDGQPFPNVVDVKSSTEYSLSANHTDKARREFLNDQTIPVEPLAVFLYRDTGFEAGGQSEPTISGLVDQFQADFGFRDSDDFDTLFHRRREYQDAFEVKQ